MSQSLSLFSCTLKRSGRLARDKAIAYSRSTVHYGSVCLISGHVAMVVSLSSSRIDYHGSVWYCELVTVHVAVMSLTEGSDSTINVPTRNQPAFKAFYVVKYKNVLVQRFPKLKKIL